MSMKDSRENVVDLANGEGGGGDDGVDFFDGLPEGFIADTLSKTSPRDVCRMSVMASIFRSAAGWNAVWEKFLPVDYEDLIGQAVLDGDQLNQLRSYTKKELYLYLCDNPILNEGGNKSFSLEKNSGKKCYMLAAKDLGIAWGDTPEYWRWTELPESRFSEVAELIKVCWFEIRGKIDTNMLSHNTVYLVYLVFKTTATTFGFDYPAAEGSISICGEEKKTRALYFDTKRKQKQRRYPVVTRQGQPVEKGPARVVYTKKRRDGWLETEIGEFLNKDGDNGELEMSIKEIKGGYWKKGLIIEGIEIRPKVCKKLK